jgi:hypothetical protein
MSLHAFQKCMQKCQYASISSELFINLPSFVKKIIKSHCYGDLSRRLRLKNHPKMAAWEMLISNCMGARSKRNAFVREKWRYYEETEWQANTWKNKHTTRNYCIQGAIPFKGPLTLMDTKITFIWIYYLIYVDIYTEHLACARTKCIN